MTAATVNSNRRAIGRPMGLSGRVAVLAISLLVGSLGVAHAAPAQQLPQVVVSYGDLDLSSSDGVRELYQRIASAAREVCPYANAREIGQVALNRSCRNEAISRAVRDVRSPQLVALRAEHAKRG
ncbi:MAG TPA: UrcA family protein [Steroidobacteraceae bacterium]